MDDAVGFLMQGLKERNLDSHVNIVIVSMKGGGWIIELCRLMKNIGQRSWNGSNGQIKIDILRRHSFQGDAIAFTTT